MLSLIMPTDDYGCTYEAIQSSIIHSQSYLFNRVNNLKGKQLFRVDIQTSSRERGLSAIVFRLLVLYTFSLALLIVLLC